ncbi:MAG: dephospho-CoA kinase [Magnetococcales bacterium]|nr:dephospho-CoA kinase [Magnetococcales bacterium]
MGKLFLLAVTGSLGCGKSRVSRWLAAQGAHLLDADQEARAVLQPGSAGWQAVVDRFGPAILVAAADSPAPRPIDRRQLGEAVFRDAEARQALEAIVHPRIYQRQALQLAQWQQAAPANQRVMVVAEIPLLFETASAHRYDWTLALLCGAAQQERLAERTGMSIEIQQAVIAQQLPEQEKAARAHQTIDNSGPWSATETQLTTVWTELLTRPLDHYAWPHGWPEASP